MANVFGRQDIKSPTERFVLLALVDHADSEGENIYPSIASVCRKTGLSERTVQGAIKSLVASGVLELDGRGKKMTNKYRYIPAPPAPPQEMHPADDRAKPETPPQEMHPTPAGDAPESSVNHHIKPKPSNTRPKDEIRKFAQTEFEKLTALPIPKRASEAGELWWHPLREICELSEWEPARIEQIIGESVQRLRKGKLTISSPKSILNTARALKGELQARPAIKYNAEEAKRKALEAMGAG